MTLQRNKEMRESPAKVANQNLQAVMAQPDMERYRLPERLTYDPQVCDACGEPFQLRSPAEIDTDDPYPRSMFRLCRRCFVQHYVQGTEPGRWLFQDLLDNAVPRLYRQAEFNTLDVSGPAGASVAAARDAVIDWAQEAVNGSRTSLYLFSEPGRTAWVARTSCDEALQAGC